MYKLPIKLSNYYIHRVFMCVSVCVCLRACVRAVFSSFCNENLMLYECIGCIQFVVGQLEHCTGMSLLSDIMICFHNE